ncbi:GNAT family N-acetyltransferase [Paenibacillus sp. GCM10012307]|uniref:GNAT family N-acetyltransferase n=1 Tax=Paenibacillus roseus TaxID=2798579 RepID=A0A934MK91_9BACL|nr:GNAT family N-acetyltransferase [Paenibacillus roseus]MBJ6360775.1 GNAT family N-acetyltransferase [Paenibacillus roseus]
MGHEYPSRREQRLSAEQFTFCPLTEAYAQEACSWRYPPPYDVFERLSWEHQKAAEIDLGDPIVRDKQYLAIVDQHYILCGYVQLFPLSGVLRLGVGLRPDLCGQGLGAPLMRKLALEARRHAPGQEIDLEVPAWNVRAIKAYEKAGFHITDTYALKVGPDWQDVHCMVLNNKE